MLLSSCKGTQAPEPQPVLDFSNDFFPFTRDYVWTYQTTISTESLITVSVFEMRIDEHTFPGGKYWAWLKKTAGSSTWSPVVALKDSGGWVSSLGSNPPATPITWFKHDYAGTNGQHDTLSVPAGLFPCVRVTLAFGLKREDTVWLSKGFGVIQERSTTGASVFSDSLQGQSVSVRTELRQVTR